MKKNKLKLKAKNDHNYRKNSIIYEVPSESSYALPLLSLDHEYIPAASQN